MEYFNRLRRNYYVKPRQELKNQIFQKCLKAYTVIHEFFFQDTSRLSNDIYHTDIPVCLQTIVDQVVNEEALQEDGETGSCLEFILKNEVLQVLCDVSCADYPKGMMKETLLTFNNLIQMTNKNFLVPYSIHRPTLKLLKSCIQNLALSILYEEELVELMFTIVTKIIDYPPLLNIFFFDKNAPVKQSKSFVSPVPEYEFLIFYFLLKFIHREGKIGDMARTAIIMTLTMEQQHPQLLPYILEKSDFPLLVASGLAGLFSQLPRSPEISKDLECALLKPLKKDLDALLQLLDFCNQIALNDRISDHILFGLLEPFKKIFLQNCVYQSVSTCLDADQSSQTLNYYLQRIMETISADSLGSIYLDFLMSTSENCLGEILWHRLESIEESVVGSCLSLLIVSFEKYPLLAIPKWIPSIQNNQKESFYLSSKRHEEILKSFSDLISFYRLEDDYGLYVLEAENRLENQARSSPVKQLLQKSDKKQEEEDDLQMQLLSNDKFIHYLQTKLEMFLNNSFELNLFLSNMIFILISSLHFPKFFHFFTRTSTAPSFYSILKKISEKIKEKKKNVNDFDKLLTNYRTQGELLISPQSTTSSTSPTSKFQKFKMRLLNDQSYQSIPSTADQDSIELKQTESKSNYLEEMEKEEKLEFIKNALLFEEMIKEIIATLQVQRTRCQQEQIQYVDLE